MEYSLGYGTSPLAAQGVSLDLWDIVETGEDTATPKNIDILEPIMYRLPETIYRAQQLSLDLNGRRKATT